MPIANDMKHIAEGIEVSYGERAAFLSDLSRGTDETLKTFHREHQQMAGDLGDFLSSDRDNREKIVSSLRGKNQRELKAMAEKLADFLKESTSSMKKDMTILLSGFDKDHQSMGKEIKEELASTTRDRIEQVKNMLGRFSAEHEAQSRQLRRQLSSFQKELASTVTEMRASVIEDLKETRRNWQNLARIMAARRAGKAVTPAQKIEAESKPEIAEAKTTIADVFGAVKLKEQMLRMISAATSGLSLAQMAKALGIPYIRLAKPAMELVKRGEIQKRDSKYFEA